MLWDVNVRRLTVGLGLAAALAVAVPAARGGGGTTYYVGSLADDGATAADCTSSANTDCELRQAIALATSGSDTVQFVSTLHGTVTLTSGAGGTLLTNASMDIVGPGADLVAVDGGGSSAVFQNGPVDLTISGLTIQNGSSGSFGGGVNNNGGSVTLTDDTLSGNTAVDGGGAVFSSGGSITLTDDTLTGNSVSAGDGGGVYSNGASATLTGDTLSDDSASGNGGAVYSDGGTVNASVDTVTSSSATNGGGMYVEGGTVTLVNDTLFDNSASGDGGSVYDDNGTVSLTDVTVAHGSAASGAGLFNNSGTVNLANSILASAGCVGTIADGGYNVESDNSCGLGGTDVVNSSTIGLDSSLSGSAPQTLAFSLPSSAFEAVPSGACTVTTDERGASRPGAGGQTACDAGAYELQTTSYTLAYSGTTAEGPAATSGNPPAGGSFVPSQTASVAGNTGAPPLALTGFAFAGWCTTDDGSDPTDCTGTSYAPGDTFAMPASDVTLYSLWSSSEPPAVTSANQTTFTVGSTGTFTVTTTGLPAPALSETGALPTGVTFTDNGDGTATLAGRPAAGTGGTYLLTIGAANGVAPDASQDFTLTVVEAPTIASLDHASFGVGEAGTFTFHTTGSPTPTVSETGGLPTGVSFTPNGDGTATLAGTPTAAGSYPLTIGAANGVGQDASQSFTLTVADAVTLPHEKSFAPTSGVAGTKVTLTGTSLLGVTEVDFTGSSAPATIFSDAATKVVVLVPSDATFGPLTIHSAVGSFTTPASFKPLPKVISLSAYDGKAGNTVTIAGTNLTGAGVVKFGTVQVTPGTTVTPATSITATVPGGTFSSGKVSVTTPTGTATSTQAYAITKVTGATVSAAAGKTVSIAGQGLGSTTAVDFDGHAGVVPSSVSATTVKVVVPGDAIPGQLTIHTPNIDVAGLTTPKPLKVTPTISNVSPVDGAVGTPVTITGTGFFADPGTAVKFGKTAGSVNVVSATEIDTTIPNGFSSGKVTVTTPGGGTAVSKQTVQITVVKAFSPAKAAAGGTITITGQGLGSATEVDFAGPATGTILVKTATALKVRVPMGATTGALTVHTPNIDVGGIQTPSFTPLPAVSPLLPTKEGTTVTIDGGAFEPGGVPPTVTLGTQQLTLTSDSDTELQATLPANAITGVLTVTTPTGTAKATLKVPPTITGGPTPGNAAPGTQVTLTGLTFTGTTKVTFANGVAASFKLSGTLGSTQTLTVTVPLRAVSGPITVTNAGGSTATASFTVNH